MQIPGGAVVACTRSCFELMRADPRRGRMVMVMLRLGGHRLTLAQGSTEQHARRRIPLQRQGHEEQPRQYGAQRAGHAAESNSGISQSDTAGRANGGHEPSFVLGETLSAPCARPSSGTGRSRRFPSVRTSAADGRTRSVVARRVLLRGEVLEDRAIGAIVPVAVFCEMASRIAHRLQLTNLLVQLARVTGRELLDVGLGPRSSHLSRPNHITSS